MIGKDILNLLERRYEWIQKTFEIIRMTDFSFVLFLRVRRTHPLCNCCFSFFLVVSYDFYRKPWKGLGRVALLSYLLGAILTSHTMLLGLLCMHKYDTIQINILQQADPRNIMLLTQWNIYMITLCIFHLAEFFITALFNPTVVTANSFIINHSKAYTCAIMVSTYLFKLYLHLYIYGVMYASLSIYWEKLNIVFFFFFNIIIIWFLVQISHTEFWIKFFFSPSLNSTYLFIIGFMITCIAQFIRSFAMKCCGESFNHIIQSDKKENHVLVTHGMWVFSSKFLVFVIYIEKVVLYLMDGY